MPKDEEIKEEEITSEEEIKEEVTPKESTEEPTEEVEDVKETKEEPQVDVEEITEQATKRAEERVAQRLLDALGVTKEDKAKAEDEGLVPPWEKEERNPKSYKEVAEFSAELAEWKREQTEKAKEEETKQAEESQKKTNEQWNKYWDDQIEELIAEGKLPKVENKEDENDPGVKARKVLFQKMYEVAQSKIKEGKQPVYSLKELFAFHYEDPNAQPAGYDAPVSLGNRAGSTPSGDVIDYNEIHNKSFDQLIGGNK
jgi:hypothetical protein